MKKNFVFVFCLVSIIANSQNIFNEGFAVFSNLATQGWISTNQSAPSGSGIWKQGGGSYFVAGGQSGGSTSFAMCDYNSVTGLGTISNWLISPIIDLKNGDVISFYTKKGGDGGSTYPDRLELRLNSTDTSVAGNPSGATSVGAFTTLAVSVNPSLTNVGYPFTWTQYTYTVTGLTGTVGCKVGFRYFVASGGTAGINSEIIGIDTFSVDRTLSSNDFFNQNFTLYPNPVSNELHISFKTDPIIKSVHVIDMNGRVVKNTMDVVVGYGKVNIADLNAGVYFVAIETQEGKGISKFIKI
jgi:hypothetical protein